MVVDRPRPRSKELHTYIQMRRRAWSGVLLLVAQHTMRACRLRFVLDVRSHQMLAFEEQSPAMMRSTLYSSSDESMECQNAKRRCIGRVLSPVLPQTREGVRVSF